LEIEMKKVALVGASTAATAASLMSSIGAAATSTARGVHRVAAGTKRGRQMVSVKTPHNRSKYMPHIGAEEQERAKRCYMEHFYPGSAVDEYGYELRPRRSSPVMLQESKRTYNAGPF
jgi:hypothetical protein